MVKKKFSGQTLAIIVLAIMLILTITFGGVFAFYSARSNKVSGTIYMATLTISMEWKVSDKSEVVISNTTNLVPGQALSNTALIVKNKSSVPIYLVVVYKLNAIKDQGEGAPIPDKTNSSVLFIGTEYINSLVPDKNWNKGTTNFDYVDYVFEALPTDKNAQDVYLESGNKKGYRCLVSMVPVEANTDEVVIEDGQLALSPALNDDYQNSMISFVFQAYAISSESFRTEFASSQLTNAEKCERIVSEIYKSQDQIFLNI